MDLLRALIAVLLFLPVAAFAQFTDHERGAVPDQILVKFRSDITDANAARSVIERAGGTDIERLGDLGWHLVKIPNWMRAADALETYRAANEIVEVQPNYYYHLIGAEPPSRSSELPPALNKPAGDRYGILSATMATPNDPQYPSLWGMTKISAPLAWDRTTGSSDVVVAVLDTGIQYTHSDLAPNMWKNPGELPNGIDDDGNGFVDDIYGYDFFYNDFDPVDENGHGTHVAGTIGAVGNNSIGVVGVNWRVKIMTIKIYDSDGYGTTSAMLINAYNYIRMMKNRGVNIRVTNNSYSGCDEACDYDQATKDAIDALGATGVLQVFAAGNDGRNIDAMPAYPASYDSPSILAVANSTSADLRNGGSNYGAAAVDLAAPGSGILSTYPNSTSYGTLSGTSMATPHVAGAAALLSAYAPSLSAASLKSSLMNSVDPLTAWTGVVKTGGRLNVATALQRPTECSFTIPMTSIRMPTKGGVITIPVSAAANCDFYAKPDVPWIRVIDRRAFSGDSSVQLHVRVNDRFRRSGRVDIGGAQLTITQSRDQGSAAAAR